MYKTHDLKEKTEFFELLIQSECFFCKHNSTMRIIQILHAIFHYFLKRKLFKNDQISYELQVSIEHVQSSGVDDIERVS